MSEIDNLLVPVITSDNRRVSEYGVFGALMAYNPSLRPVGSYKGSASGIADTFSSASAVNSGTNVTTLTCTDFTKFEMYGFGMVASSIIGSTTSDEHSLITDYLRGELSGSFSILCGMTNTTIDLPAQGSNYDSWWSALNTTFTFSDEWSRQIVIRYGGFDHSLTGNREDWETNSVLRVLSKLIPGATRLVIRSTEAREQFQATAVANMLVLISLVTKAVASAIHSIFVLIIVTRIIIRTLMAHRNSREPAYSPIFYQPLYQSLAGVARAH